MTANLQEPTIDAVAQAPSSRRLASGSGRSGVDASVGAALLVARRFKELPGQRRRATSSTFSALNVETLLGSHAWSRPGLITVNVAAAMAEFRRTAEAQESKVARALSGSTRAPTWDSDHFASLKAASAAASSANSDQDFEISDDVGLAFSKASLLRYRFLADGQAPSEVKDLNAADVMAPVASGMSRQVTGCSDISMGPWMSTPVSRQVTPRPDMFMSMSRQVDGTFSRQETTETLASMPCSTTPSKTQSIRATPRCRTTSLRAADPASRGSETAQSPSFESLSRSPKTMTRSISSGPHDELKRTVQGLLNKVCPENVSTIVQKIGAVEINEPQQLEVVIELIFKKALTEPHYCETYADLVFALKSVFPEFRSPDGGSPITFKSSVLNICQNEFEELLTSLEPTVGEKAQYSGEDLDMCKKRRKDRMMANMKFIGHLYLRQLLSAKVIGSVSRELVSCENADDFPEEHQMESACELLLAIGFTLEALPTGQQVLHQVCSRLLDLKTMKTASGKTRYCKRVQFMIQDLLDTRAAGWSKKSFKAAAKTKEEIRQDQRRDMCRQCSSEPEVVVQGQRPLYLSTALGA